MNVGEVIALGFACGLTSSFIIVSIATGYAGITRAIDEI